MSSVFIIPTPVFKNPFNIILLSMPGSSKWSLPYMLSDPGFVHIYRVSDAYFIKSSFSNLRF
jgi:hypothetical protein